jgi:AcrR family transcriptional regulator
MVAVRSHGPNRRARAAAEARSRILSAAADCIVRDGLAQVRMAAIAQAAGVSSGLLHYHVDTKEQLFAAVLAHCHDVSGVLNQDVVRQAGAEPAQRLSTFLDRCLPSDERLEHEWLLWQELAMLCVRQPELAEVGEELYEDLYSAVVAIITEGADAGVFEPTVDARTVARTAVASCDGLGARVLAHDVHLSLDDARAALAATVGVLVGHDGPLPPPVGVVAHVTEQQRRDAGAR